MDRRKNYLVSVAYSGGGFGMNITAIHVHSIEPPDYKTLVEVVRNVKELTARSSVVILSCEVQPLFFFKDSELPLLNLDNL